MDNVNDLKIIRRKYGEKMAHFCRDNFASILEVPGLLSSIFLENFHDSHILYDDIVSEQKETAFKNYIYKLANIQTRKKVVIAKTPEELMNEAGYILRECYTEEDIQAYKKYYAPGEALCTFKGGRLNRCRVFFAVKKNVGEINREIFKNPLRQDEYGTSVISIQFTKDGLNTLSIKNRYNHTVDNPDATFSNDLDNIIAGLTDSFEQHKGIVQKGIMETDFYLKKYTVASDGKLYKYNYEIGDIYFCPDNIIIDDLEIKKYDKSRYLIMNYYILDMSKGSKGIKIYEGIQDDHIANDCFSDTVKDVTNIDINNDLDGKRVVVSNDKGESLYILLDQNNQIVGLKIKGVSKIGDDFMFRNDPLLTIEAPDLVQVGSEFMMHGSTLLKASFSKLEVVGDDFLGNAKSLQKIDAPCLRKVGSDFLHSNRMLCELSLPDLVEMGNSFMRMNNSLVSLSVPKLTKMERMTLINNSTLEKIEAPELLYLGDGSLRLCKNLQELNAPKIEYIGERVLERNEVLHDRLVAQIEENNNRGMRR